MDAGARGRLEPGGAAISSSFFLHSRILTHFTSSEVSVTAGSSLLIRDPGASSLGNHLYMSGHQHQPNITSFSRMTNHLSFPGTLLVLAQKVCVPEEQGGWSPHLFPEVWAPLHPFSFSWTWEWQRFPEVVSMFPLCLSVIQYPVNQSPILNSHS